MKASKVVTAVLGTVMALGLMVGTASADTSTTQSDGSITTAKVVTTQGRGADAGKTISTVTVTNSKTPKESTTIVYKTDDGVTGENCPPRTLC
ncbi:unannotated protein [freshwater metagenome]|jgi:hypothetical protein|uniref:Unannotated protein n=1 Tax=freshwater metagenome TaxID=449393 RepID=A0A6J7RH37_9ZZZZ|nr:hypothetical protein [Actinomycetota bacterium]MSV95170.1 hypothetical protein [Actinomycetota bacterium]MSW61275.1 hypothetical protein [Actinomycetota bacterium]MSY44850.1 hypothetical protein [Actinomycetota bacterium]